MEADDDPRYMVRSTETKYRGRAAAFCTDKVCLETDQCAITDSRCRPIMTKLIQIELQCPYGTRHSCGIDLYYVVVINFLV